MFSIEDTPLHYQCVVAKKDGVYKELTSRTIGDDL